MVSADTICAAPHWQTSNCSIANGKYGNSRRNNILRDDAVDDFSRGPRHIPAMGDFIDHALIWRLTVAKQHPLQRMKTRISGFGPKWRQMRWVLVTARGYENLRMEFAVNVLDLVRSCLLTHRACQRRGFHTQLVSKRK